MSNYKLPSATAGSPHSNSNNKDPYVYQAGFGNRFVSEAVPGIIPKGRNTPQKVKYGLYTEQLNGTVFVTPRATNQHAWLYRIRPSVTHSGFTPLPELPDLEHNFLTVNPKITANAAQLAWDPISVPTEPTEFVEGIKTLLGVGDSTIREGLAFHLYAANKSMEKRAFVNTDGDFLILPIQGRLDIQTEMGKLMVHVGELAVIQRGIKFKVKLPDGPSRGYIQEVFGVHYDLPELGPLGANGMAGPRDFESPVAAFDIDQTPWELFKIAGSLHLLKQPHTPFDVVAWHGNYVPYKYDLDKFVRISSVSHDHLDPSVLTVLTAKSKTAGTALSDLAIFTPRWEVADCFRPPYFHRNTASEIVGLVYGKHGAGDEVVEPGAVHLVNPFTPHGFDPSVYKAASELPLAPQRLFEDTIIFVFEVSMPLMITDFAMKRAGKKPPKERDPKHWAGFKPEFIERLDEVNKDLRALGLAELKK